MSARGRVKRKDVLIERLRRLECASANQVIYDLDRLHKEDIETYKVAQKFRWRIRARPHDADAIRAHAEAHAVWEATQKSLRLKLDEAYQFIIANSAVGLELVHPDVLQDETSKLALPETLPVLDAASVSAFCDDFRTALVE